MISLNFYIKGAILFSLLVGSFPMLTYGFIDTAQSGNWSDPATWSSGISPASNDTLLIPIGETITIDCNCGTYSGMVIMVFGVLSFPGGRKINLTADGIIDVYTNGLITGDNNGDKIIIDGDPVWTGSMPPITGPASCISGGCSNYNVLPVELLYFKTTAQKDNIELGWGTATETRNAYFTIWKSLNCQSWYELARVYGAGNSWETQHYLFEDREVLNGRTCCYKLSQTDFDGALREVGEISSTTWFSDKGPGIRIYPNPLDGNLFVRVPEEYENWGLILLASNGQIVLKTGLHTGQNTFETGTFGKGIFMAQITFGNGMCEWYRLVVH